LLNFISLFKNKKGGKEMPTKTKKNVIGTWSFLIGIILTIALGLFSDYLGSNTYRVILVVLVVLGIAIGLLNISAKESTKFLLTALVLVLVASIGYSDIAIIPQIGKILGALLVLFVPATIIVALKSIFDIARN
jgi:hypothetical protein